MKYFLLLLAVCMAGCKQKPTALPDFQYPSEMNLILHLKESNYEIGIASHPSMLRPGEGWILKAYVDKGNILYMKDVKDRVQ